MTRVSSGLAALSRTALALSCAAWFGVAGFVAHAQDDGGSGDVVVEDSGGGLLGEEDSGAATLSGSFVSAAYAAAGWLDPAAFFSFGDGLAAGVYAEADAILEIVAAPLPFTEFVARFSFGFPGSGADVFDWSALAIERLYCSTLVFDAIYVTVGKFADAWGRGRYLTPGDFVDGLEDGFALKLAYAAGPLSFRAVAFGNEAVFDDPAAPTFAELVWAGSAELALDGALLAMAGRWQRDDGGVVSASTKTGLGPVDLYAEGFLYLDGVDVAAGALAGAYWFSQDPKLLLALEWSWDGRVSLGHALSFVAAWSRVFGTPLRFALRWDHRVSDGSGAAIALLDWQLGGGLALSFAVPWFYGPANGLPWLVNEDPEGRRLFALLKLEYRLSF